MTPQVNPSETLTWAARFPGEPWKNRLSDQPWPRWQFELHVHVDFIYLCHVPLWKLEHGRVGAWGGRGEGGGCWILLWMAPLEMHVWFQKVDKALAHFGSLEPSVVSQITTDAREVRRPSLRQRFLRWAGSSNVCSTAQPLWAGPRQEPASLLKSTSKWREEARLKLRIQLTGFFTRSRRGSRSVKVPLAAF